MRILILNYEYPPLGGGAGNAMYHILKEFTHHKDLIIDVITSSTGSFQKESFSDEITVYKLGIGKNSKRYHVQSQKDLLIYSWKAFCFARKLKKKYSYQLIHAFFGIPSGFIASLLHIPFIVSLRGTDVPFYNERFWILDRLIFKGLSKYWIWKKAKTVIVNSKGLHELAKRTAPGITTDLIPNGVDLREFRPRPNLSNNKDLQIISNSRLITRKGITYLIDGFEKHYIEHPNSNVFLIGDGALKRELQKQVQRAGLEKCVHFVGIIPHKEVPKYYEQSDVFVLPSLNEGMSNSLLEAMASGLAIITTDTGGTAELVNYRNGIIIQKRNASDIAKALNKLSEDRTILLKMKCASREKVKSMSWDKVALQYKQIYLK